MRLHDRSVAIGMLCGVFTIALAWAFLAGFGQPVNPGILTGPVVVGLFVLWKER